MVGGNAHEAEFCHVDPNFSLMSAFHGQQAVGPSTVQNSYPLLGMNAAGYSSTNHQMMNANVPYQHMKAQKVLPNRTLKRTTRQHLQGKTNQIDPVKNEISIKESNQLGIYESK